MPQRSKGHSRRQSDPLEAVKPLVVLGLLGMILYGAYGVIRRGPQAPTNPVGLEPPSVAIGGEAPAFGSSAEPGVAPPTSQAASPAVPGADAFAGPATTAIDPTPPAPPLVLKAVPAPPPDMAAPVAELSAGSVPPANAPATQVSPSFPDDQTSPSVPAVAGPGPQEPEQAGPRGGAAAFANAWTDAHEKLAAARYAEALGILSRWYDDPSLGPEETHRLEALLGQLAGTVIYSQEDHLLPPHIVAPGENLREIASGLQLPWQVLGKINGVDAPAKLVPGEPLKLVPGPFDASVSLSRRRLSLQLKGNYAGSFPVVIGRQVHDHVGAALAVQRVRRGGRIPTPPTAGPVQQASNDVAQNPKQILLLGGVVIESADDPTAVAETAAGPSLIVSARDLDELIDILGDGSRVFVRP